MYVHTNPYIRHVIRKSCIGGRVITGIQKFEFPIWEKVKNVLNKYLEVEFPVEGIPDLIRWYSTNIVKPTMTVLQKFTGLNGDKNIF